MAVNLNTAAYEELMTIPGVGEKRATGIVGGKFGLARFGGQGQSYFWEFRVRHGSWGEGNSLRGG